MRIPSPIIGALLAALWLMAGAGEGRAGATEDELRLAGDGFNERVRMAPARLGPASDADVRKLADELWGRIDGRTATENRCGKGRVIAGRSLADVLGELDPPDFDYTLSGAAGMLRYIHRRTDDTDFYFVANADNTQSLDAVARFRVTGKAPEFWDAATGEITRPVMYRQIDGVTELPLHFDPAGPVFVVFRRPVDATALVAVNRSDAHGPGTAPPVRPRHLIRSLSSDLYHSVARWSGTRQRFVANRIVFPNTRKPWRLP